MIKIYNTLSRRPEDFLPIENKTVRFYQCGPTVYWVQHIGNLRAMVLSDLIRRSLLYLGYKVKFVRNYTDVGHLVSDADEGEDKMEKASKREKLTPQQIAQKYIDIFENDIKALNIFEPDVKPRASEYINEMIEMIQVLLKKNYAYITDLAIYFDVTKFSSYTKLSRQKLDLQQPNSGHGKVIDTQKRHYYDFALWFFKKGEHKNALQTWPSPWGEGFPGWHIECSVMSIKLLGETIDIHMGGVEHIPIHHTNEIAQTEAYTGKKFVNYWVHNEHLLVNNEKMAKSTGSFHTLNDVIQKGFDPLDLRYFYLQAHYRSTQNFTWEALTAAKNAFNKLKSFVSSLIEANPENTNLESKLSHEYKDQFKRLISNDFQIPQALALTWKMIDDQQLNDQEKLSLMFDFDRVFGLNLNQIQPIKIPDEIIQLAKDREEARKNKNFTLADNIREKIKAKGYLIEDTDNGYVIKKNQSLSI
jgi:cysteinyl-tRNA synthetase